MKIVECSKIRRQYCEKNERKLWLEKYIWNKRKLRNFFIIFLLFFVEFFYMTVMLNRKYFFLFLRQLRYWWLDDKLEYIGFHQIVQFSTFSPSSIISSLLLIFYLTKIDWSRKKKRIIFDEIYSFCYFFLFFHIFILHKIMLLFFMTKKKGEITKK